MPLDISEFFAADFTAPQRGVWMALRMHIWFHGKLPRTAKGLAEIGKVHVRTWRAMEETIAPHFDIDEDGRWRHLDLEAEREAALTTRAKRAAANAKNADKRWGRDGVAEEVAPDTNGNANGIADDAAGSDGERSLALPPAQPRAPGAGGQSDRQTLVQTIENIEETDGRTDARSARDTSVGTTNGTAARPESDFVPQSKSNGKSAIDADAPHASGNANGIAGSDASGDAKPPAIDPPESVSDAEIFRVLRDGAADKIPAHLLTREGIAPIRVLMSEGCVFARDIGPAFVAGARGLKRPLDSLRAAFLHEMARANRDEAKRRLQTTSGQAASGKVPVAVDTPEWRAWLGYLGRKSFPVADLEIDGRRQRGWSFDSLWPPGASVDQRNGATSNRGPPQAQVGSGG